jgi:hypothetical protein
MNQKAGFPMALKCVQITGQSVLRRKDIILQRNALLMSVIQIKTFSIFFKYPHIIILIVITDVCHPSHFTVLC